MSVMRISVLSIVPPTNPDVAPIVVPIEIAISIAAIPTASEMRPP